MLSHKIPCKTVALVSHSNRKHIAEHAVWECVGDFMFGIDRKIYPGNAMRVHEIAHTFYIPLHGGGRQVPLQCRWQLVSLSHVLVCVMERTVVVAQYCAARSNCSHIT